MDNWQGQRFAILNLEGDAQLPLKEQAQDVFGRAHAELQALGLSLRENTVRTRMLGRSAQARTAGSDARTAALTGNARAAGSSYISPAHFGSAADVGIDLFAMAAPDATSARQVTEHQPVQSFIRHLVWGPMLLLAGMTCETQPTLEAQLATYLPRAGAAAARDGCRLEECGAGVAVPAPGPGSGCAAWRDRRSRAGAAEHAEIEQVDGFSRPVKLIEVEVTAKK